MCRIMVDLEVTFDLAVKSCLSYTLETVRHRKFLVIGALVRRCRCTMSWCDLDLAFDLAVVTLTYKILCRTYLRNCNT